MAQAHAAQAALLEAGEQFAPARGAFPPGDLHGEDLAAAFPVDADGHEHRARADDSVLAHFLVARIEDEAGELHLQRPPGKALQFPVQLHVHLADGRGAELMTAELLGDRLDLPCRDALRIHLHQCRHERLLAALVALEEPRGETPLPVPRHAQFHGAHARDQPARVVATAVALPALTPLALGSTKRIGHLRLKDFLQEPLHQWRQHVGVLCHQCFEFRHTLLIVLSDHGCFWVRVAWSLPSLP